MASQLAAKLTAIPVEREVKRAVLITDVQDDEYFGDIFSDERMLMEELEVDDFLTNASSANEDIWDMLDITDEDWMDAQPDGFFMP